MRGKCVTSLAIAAGLFLTLHSIVETDADVQAGGKAGSKTPDKVVDQALTKDLAQKRLAEIDMLLQVVRTPSQQGQVDRQKRWAVRLLGELRASEAAKDLVERISVPLPGLTASSVDLLEIYPSVGSLIRIGNPAIDAIFQRLRSFKAAEIGQKKAQVQLYLFAYVIRSIDGHEVGLYRIENQLKIAEKEYGAKGEYYDNLVSFLEIYKKKTTDIETWDLIIGNREEINRKLRIPNDNAGDDPY